MTTEKSARYCQYNLLFGDDEGTTYCHVSIRVNGIEYCNSLTFIENYGGIEVNGEIVAIEPINIDYIRNWADAQGY